MIAFIARFIGLWLIAGALVALVVDGTRTIANSQLEIYTFGEFWKFVSFSSLQAAERFIQNEIETYTGHWLWNPLIMWILLLPTWLVLGLLGALLVYVGRKRRTTVAYAS